MYLSSAEPYQLTMKELIIPHISTEDFTDSSRSSETLKFESIYATETEIPSGSTSSTLTLSSPGPAFYNQHDGYHILRLAPQDDAEFMARWKRILYRTRPLVIACEFCSYWLYFIFRIWCNLAAQRDAHRVFWTCWVFILVEASVVVPMFLLRLWGLHLTGSRKRSRLRLMGDDVPTVDVIITCCKEDDDVILDTAKAACNIDYPQDKFRVILCDDGQSQSLKHMAIKLSTEPQFSNLHYRSRQKLPGVPHHYKAGNLNFALEQTALLPGGPAGFLAALDADMVPEREWLRALLPHMLMDQNCAMACPPQLFYNIPTDDPLCQSLSTFAHVTEPIKDAMGVAWCTGSGYVMRRDAIHDIGGFPVGSVAEDVYCSSLMLGAGWNTAFIHEELQNGLVPDSLTSHLKQRTRWTIGTVQTAVKLRFCLWGPLIRKMTIAQRACGFFFAITGFFTLFLIVSMFGAPVVLIAGGRLVPYATMNQLRWLMRSCFLMVFFGRCTDMIHNLPSGYRAGQREIYACFWMTPFHATAIVRTFLLPKWLGGKIAGFTSTGSQKAELNERDPKLRASLWRRLKVVLWDCNCYLHLFYMVFVGVAIAISTYNVLMDKKAYHGTKGILIGVMTHAAWPPMIWIAGAFSCWEPIRYAIWPPSMPDREELLDRDQKTGVAYPSDSAKKLKTSWVSWALEFPYALLTLNTIAVFAWSWFI